MAQLTLAQCLGVASDHVITTPSGIQANPLALDDFHRLQTDAAQHGFDLQACSGFRSFERQAMIVSRKFLGQRPILDRNEQPLAQIPADPVERLQALLYFSAMPGFSRHHFGTDFDIYAPNCLPEGQQLQLTYHEYAEDSYFYEFGLYLKENLQRFGFFNPYDGLKTDLLGPEPWHISHRASVERYLDAYDPEQALAYVEQQDLPFSPYVRQVMTAERIEAVLQLSMR